MKKSEASILKVVLSNIEDTTSRINSLKFAVDGIMNSYNPPISAHEEYSHLYLELYKKLRNDYEQLMFFSLFSDDIRKEAQRLTFERYLASKVGIDTAPEMPHFGSDIIMGLPVDLAEEFLDDIKKKIIQDRSSLSRPLQEAIEKMTVKEAIEMLGGKQ